MIVVYIGLIMIVLCIIGAIITSFMEYLPWLFDRKEYKIWKKCYNNENFALHCIKYTSDGKNVNMYKTPDLPYSIFVFHETDKADACIFLNNSYNIVFSSFYKKHSNKLVEKLEGKKN